MFGNTKSSCSGLCWSRTDLVFLLVIIASLIVIINARSSRAPADAPAIFAQNLTLPAASKASAESGMPVLVYATATWCGPCQSFKRGALSDPEVQSLITSRTLPVYLDIDKHRETASMLGITSIPKLILMKDSQILASRVGALSSAQTTEFILEHTSPESVSSED